MNPQFFAILASLTLLSPVMLLAFACLAPLWARDEKLELEISKATLAAMALGLVSITGIAIGLSLAVQFETQLDLGHWIKIDDHLFHFHLTFIFDRLSIPFVIMIYILCGTVGAFTTKYLHRESGFQRFFILYSLFVLGMVVSALAGSIEVLFFGWELVGLSSALLVGFFHERIAPAINGLRVWAIYRFADAAFLLAAVQLHHATGEGDFHLMSRGGVWPEATSTLSASNAMIAGLLLLIAVAGKSALIPYCGWLPRAMEGPTASSAIFYGALSVHLGVYLLLRVSPIFSSSLALSIVVVTLGMSTAVYANLVERVQADIKSALAFASLAQVGLIVAEIGMGWHYLALMHILGHAALRTLQLLRAPSLLQDYFKLETALGQRVAFCRQDSWLTRHPQLHRSLYRLALNRGYLDSLLDDWLVVPALRMFQWCSRAESAWIHWWETSFGRPSSRCLEPNQKHLQSEFQLPHQPVKIGQEEDTINA